MVRDDDWFLTLTGRKVHVLNPQPDQICLEDIAGALSRICRFGGMIANHYSVAQHSVLVSKICPPELAQIGLLHDATEAYLGDVIGPLKRYIGPAYHELEEMWAIAIAVHFKLPSAFALSDLNPLVKQADLVAYATECRDLRSGQSVNHVQAKPHSDRIAARPAAIACLDFVERFYQLFPDRSQPVVDNPIKPS